ncbi:MAG: hypothetical protein J5824_00240 [Lachnospiraceae bacterium]|nr:hypothetical protein [Lachnospiraceae bacterium]
MADINDIKLSDVAERNAKLFQKKTATELENFMADAEISEEESKLAALTEDKDFLKSLLITKDDLEAVKLFAKRGIEMVEEECQDIRNMISESLKGIAVSKEEMSDDELEAVTGGSWKGFWKGFKKVAVAALIGAAVGFVAAMGVATFGAAFLGAGCIGSALGGALLAGAAGGAINAVVKEGATPIVNKALGV